MLARPVAACARFLARRLPRALSWLRKQDANEPRPPERERVRAQRRYNAAIPILRQVGRLLHRDVVLPGIDNPQVRADRDTLVIAAAETPLGEFARTVHQLAEQTGATEPSLVAFV